MNEREKSREEWEREFTDVQRGVTPGEWLRADQIMARKLSASPAPIPDFAHLVRAVLSGVLLALAIAIFSSNIPHKMWFGLAALVAGCCLGTTAFQRKRKS
jgi:hypothetical protein